MIVNKNPDTMKPIDGWFRTEFILDSGKRFPAYVTIGGGRVIGYDKTDNQFYFEFGEDYRNIDGLVLQTILTELTK